MAVLVRSTLLRKLASALIVSMGAMSVTAPAHAGLIATESVVASAEPARSDLAAGHARLAAALGRAEVVDILRLRGVDPRAAQARVVTLSDSEAARLADQIDEAPAGGINAVGAVALVFVILVVTDILGFTRIFSFTSPIK